MFELKTKWNDKKFNLIYSQEILDFSYPNKNYEQIALSTFNLILGNLGSKNSSLIKKIFSLSDEFNFIHAHGGYKKGKWVFFPDLSEKGIIISDYIKNLNNKNPNSYSILYVCNDKSFKLDNSRVIYPLSKVHSIDIKDDKWAINL